MTLDAALRAALLAHVPELMAAISAELERPRLLPIKETGLVSYRWILEQEKLGNVRVYRAGQSSLVDEAELIDCIKRVGVERAEPAPEHRDEIADLISLQDNKRRTRRGRAA